MREIDLRNWSISKNVRAWWVDYLAYLASTPRNWIECKLEPPTTQPNTHMRVIDLWTPEELGVANGYPTDGLSLWWLIICLDGAPERMRHETQVCQQSLFTARELLAPAENLFRSLIVAKQEQLSQKPAVSVLGNWRDGMIIGYEAREPAVDLAIHVAGACAALNADYNLSWIHQYHIRAGIGHSVRQAFSKLLHARRNQLCCTLHGSTSESPQEITLQTTHLA